MLGEDGSPPAAELGLAAGQSRPSLHKSAPDTLRHRAAPEDVGDRVTLGSSTMLEWAVGVLASGFPAWIERADAKAVSEDTVGRRERSGVAPDAGVRGEVHE